VHAGKRGLPPRLGEANTCWVIDLEMEGELEMSIAQTVENRFIGGPRHQPGSGIVKLCQRTQLSRWSTQLAQVSRREG
jgi:hypothetical protein